MSRNGSLACLPSRSAPLQLTVVTVAHARLVVPAPSIRPHTTPTLAISSSLYRRALTPLSPVKARAHRRLHPGFPPCSLRSRRLPACPATPLVGSAQPLRDVTNSACCRCRASCIACLTKIPRPWSSSNHRTLSCRALGVFDGIPEPEIFAILENTKSYWDVLS